MFIAKLHISLCLCFKLHINIRKKNHMKIQPVFFEFFGAKKGFIFYLRQINCSLYSLGPNSNASRNSFTKTSESG